MLGSASGHAYGCAISVAWAADMVEEEDDVFLEVFNGPRYLLGSSYVVFSLRYVGDLPHQTESFRCCSMAGPKAERNFVRNGDCATTGPIGL